MSRWAHITLTAEVYSEGWTSPEELRAQVLEELNNASGITGSEADAGLYVVPLPSASTEFNRGKTYHYFDNALVVVHGHLRDRTTQEAEAETNAFIQRLKGHFDIIRDLEYHVWSDDEEPLWIRPTEEYEDNEEKEEK